MKRAGHHPHCSVLQYGVLRLVEAMTRVVAIVAVRNEACRIQTLIRSWQEAGIDLIVIDNESDDGSQSLLREYIGRGVKSIFSTPWRGAFSLREQLAVKFSVLKSLDYDWVVHADADEWLQPPFRGVSLADAISRVDREGFNCINFEEFVFLPEGMAGNQADYRHSNLRYYFFEPSKQRLNRAWKVDSHLDSLSTGGHVLTGVHKLVYPTSFPLKHYIVLSSDHARQKYAQRVFDKADLEKGWHKNRLNLADFHFRLPPSEMLQLNEDWQSVSLDKSLPYSEHFWEWHY